MTTPAEQLDRRFAQLADLSQTTRPARGWIKAVREALGMTTTQLAHRLDMAQPSLVELERREKEGAVTMQSLQRAAEAMGCRFVYALVPVRPLTDTINERADELAERELAAVEQTMKLEAQGVNRASARRTTKKKIIEALLQRPARLWDEV